ncbi:MAG: hypothetical protein ACPLZG_01905, partial [Thermoproteota archaeon]
TMEQPTIFRLHWWLIFTGIIAVLIGVDLYLSGSRIDVLLLAGSLMSFSMAYLLGVLGVQFNIKNKVVLPLLLLFLFISISAYVYNLFLSPYATFVDLISVTIMILGELSFICKFIKVYFKRKT